LRDCLSAGLMKPAAGNNPIRTENSKINRIPIKSGTTRFRATGITAHLKNGGKLEAAQHITNHE
jgi:hypothetical protein